MPLYTFRVFAGQNGVESLADKITRSEIDVLLCGFEHVYFTLDAEDRARAAVHARHVLGAGYTIEEVTYARPV